MPLTDIGRPWSALVFPLFWAFAILTAWTCRFVQDDAFISFRYARNLARGVGLVFNVGERVEGYTNFLWTVLMAPSFLCKIDVVVWSQTISIACFAVTLVAYWRWVSDECPGFAVWTALALLGTNYSALCYATGGLETQFGVMWSVLTALALSGGARHYLVAGLCSACAVMTRMDGVLLIAPFWLAAVLRQDDRRNVLVGAFAGAVPVIVWLLWRHSYYGSWVPNTFLIKGRPNPLRGMVYVASFTFLYGYVVLLPFLRVGTLVSLGRRHWPLLTTVLLWYGYVIFVGGDFMEYRLIVSGFPFLALAVALVLNEHRAFNSRKAIFLACFLVFLGLVGLPRFLNGRMIQPVPDLVRFSADCRACADALVAEYGPGLGGRKVAVSPAGVIPFYTDAPAFDVLGLNHRDVALYGSRVRPKTWLGNRPAHTRVATSEQVKAYAPDLIVCHPRIVSADDPLVKTLDRTLYDAIPSLHVPLPIEARLKVLPLADDRRFVFGEMPRGHGK